MKKQSLKPQANTKSEKPAKLAQMLDGDELRKFKEAVDGSDQTKVVLLGLLKKQ